MSVRRVVTGIDDEGKSYIARDEPAPFAGGFFELWSTDGPVPEPLPQGDLVTGLEPPPGGTWWRVFSLPPEAEMKGRLAGAVPGIDPDGFHTTASVDYVLVLDGDITLKLDRGSVDLHTGDCVVQRATRHAWANQSDRPTRMMVVMVSSLPLT
ncbi:MAG: cupin domain-containing protein [Actinobacteria bacterium]|nr:cupin domain-containing protein [Actinomycetota bacterium]